MSHEMPDNSVEKKEAVPAKLKEVFASHERLNDIFKLEVTPEEIKLFNELLDGGLSAEEIQAQGVRFLNNELFEEWETAVGPRKDELDKLNAEMWRMQAVYHAAKFAKQEKAKQSNT